MSQLRTSPRVVDSKKKEKQLTSPNDVQTEPKFSIQMDASTILKGCKGQGLDSLTNFSILNDRGDPPQPPEPPIARLTRKHLLPTTPSLFVNNKKEAFSPQTTEFCLKHPIAVIQGLTTALELNMDLFSSKTLVKANPDQSVEIRTQVQQASDENWDRQIPKKRVWVYKSYRSFTSVAKYTQYQVSFQDSLNETQTESETSSKNDSKNNLPFSNSKESTDKVQQTKATVSSSPRIKEPPGPNILKFGTNVDLSNERKWRQQLQELTKLPAFACINHPENMLSHVGHSILGVNTVQMYMKVPYNRTPAHQENNNFCSININIGPGDCEWFAVANPYWGVVYNLCKRNNVDYLHGSWWPILDDLYQENVPVYRFLQKPGELVWVNVGCVHWVQAVGVCNNIAWNVGPMTACQYHSAIERYEWNKTQKYKSIVPMIHLSWNLARNVKVTDPKLFELIKYCLLRTLRYCAILLEYIKAKGVEVQFNGREKDEVSHYCCLCEVEVFNILFIQEQKRRNIVHCLDCSLKLDPTLDRFDCLEEYRMSQLMKIYDNFVLHPMQSTSSSLV